MDIETIIDDFFNLADADHIEIYNEFSFQHELGIYLRHRLPQYKVQFERNISFFIPDKNTIKKEIDISIYDILKNEKYAIELKYPLNGQYPEQMYSFIKDVKFMECLKENGFTQTFVVVLVKDKPFYEGKNNTGIYNIFRESYIIKGQIYKPTGSRKTQEFIQLDGSYSFKWRSCLQNHRYYCIRL